MREKGFHSKKFEKCELTEEIFDEFMNDNGGFLSLIKEKVKKPDNQTFLIQKILSFNFKQELSTKKLVKIASKNTFELTKSDLGFALNHPIYTIMKSIPFLSLQMLNIINFTMYIVMTRFLDIVVKQGEGIITSLEHMKYFFLHASIGFKSLIKYNNEIGKDGELEGGKSY